MKKRVTPLPSLEWIRKTISYDSETGDFTWLINRSNTLKGSRAGCISSTTGYRVLSIRGLKVSAHKLAWYLHYGEYPESQIDHINGLRADNRIENLRCVSPSVNGQNRWKAQANNKVGLMGVCKRGSKYIATIILNKKQTYLGIFSTKEDAHLAYLSAKLSLHSQALA